MLEVSLLGAFDRNNYGDILFPIIVEKSLNKRGVKANYRYFALIDSDLSDIGAVKSESIDKFYVAKKDIVIVTGGDVLPVKWTGMEYNLRKNIFQSKIRSLIYRLFPTKKEILARKKLKGKTSFPWVITRKVVNDNTLIIYNTIGGANLNGFSTNEKQALFSDLNDADFISVRDRKTFENISQKVVNEVVITPDSAIVMSDFFSRDVLKQLISSELKQKLGWLENEYIVFQIGEYYAQKNIDVIVQNLNSVLNNTKYNILLLPIGRAWGHSDQIPLSLIYEELVKGDYFERVFMPKSNTIYDTMYYILSSELFIGTSLHGCITALSYSNPCIAMDNRVVKLSEFLKEFSHDEQLYGIPYANIYSSILDTLKIDKRIHEDVSNELKELVNMNFDRMCKIIKENESLSKDHE